MAWHWAAFCPNLRPEWVGGVPHLLRSEMAKAEHIKALIRCHAEGDDTRFYAVAMQVGPGHNHPWLVLSPREV